MWCAAKWQCQDKPADDEKQLDSAKAHERNLTYPVRLRRCRVMQVGFARQVATEVEEYDHANCDKS